MNREEVINLLSKKYIPEDKKEELKKVIVTYFSKRDLAKQLLEFQPMYYDESKLWWWWNFQTCCWEITDETNLMNVIDKLSIYNTVRTNERGEILEALRQESRKTKPKDRKDTWLQFKDEIFDLKDGKIFKATPEYFVTNPIPYGLHPERFENTPIMDKIFEEWVGKKYVKTLYQIIAYCLIPSYPVHRLFCFLGAGLNGKSCFLNLLKKFLGDKNVCSTELDMLLTSRFEITRLHKKLVCLMGETNFNEMSKTSILKKLTGGDMIGFEYKQKNPFQDNNYAKIIIATNNLPATTDKTMGFYRRWMIVDFPNKFGEKKDILKEIPEEEYESLALKCTGILNDLLKERAFYNEGSVEDRMRRYEEKSNFLEKFVELFTDTEDPNAFITKTDFYKKFVSWCRENKFRDLSDRTVGKKMKELGHEQAMKTFTWMNDGKGGQARVWLGIKWKE